MPCLLIQLLRPRVRKGADPLLIADQESLLQIADQLIDLAVKECRFSLFITMRMGSVSAPEFRYS